MKIGDGAFGGVVLVAAVVGGVLEEADQGQLAEVGYPRHLVLKKIYNYIFIRSHRIAAYKLRI